jgi:hypothetical protein
MVRIHPDPPIQASPGFWPAGYLGGYPVAASTVATQGRGCSSIGRAPALQAGGRRFDPVQLHQHPGRRNKPWSSKPAVPIDCSSRFQVWACAVHACPKLKAVALFNNLEGKACMNLMRVRAR